jgi:D-aminoacyl-tRNA deacylase
MIGIVYSDEDTASYNIAHYIVETHGFKPGEWKGRKCFVSGDIAVLASEEKLINSEFLDSLGFSMIYFASRHRSAAGIASFTAHSTGNWTQEAKLGGRPKSLSVAAPAEMLNVIRMIFSSDEATVEKTYEATHHGPLLETPSIFVELGGSEEALANTAFAARIGDTIHRAASAESCDYSCVVIGIGGGHYPSKFSKLAVENGYAFSHILPKYATTNTDGSSNLDMISAAIERSSVKAEKAVIDWKGLPSPVRSEAIKILSGIGIEYEKV